MQHQPHAAALVQADLDEVIARAQRAEVVAVVGLLQPRVVAAQRLEVARQRGPGGVDLGRHLVPGTRIAPTGPAAVRHGALDGQAQRLQVVGQVLGVQRGPGGHHAAADVDAHRRRDDGLAGRDHRTHRGADAHVHVGHGRHMPEHDRQARHVAQLLDGLGLDRYPACPHLQRYATGNVHVNVIGLHDDTAADSGLHSDQS